jgi:hypothetical protein
MTIAAKGKSTFPLELTDFDSSAITGWLIYEFGFWLLALPPPDLAMQVPVATPDAPKPVGAKIELLTIRSTTLELRVKGRQA